MKVNQYEEYIKELSKSLVDTYLEIYSYITEDELIINTSTQHVSLSTFLDLNINIKDGEIEENEFSISYTPCIDKMFINNWNGLNQQRSSYTNPHISCNPNISHYENGKLFYSFLKFINDYPFNEKGINTPLIYTPYFNDFEQITVDYDYLKLYTEFCIPSSTIPEFLISHLNITNTPSNIKKEDIVEMFNNYYNKNSKHIKKYKTPNINSINLFYNDGI